MEAFAPIAAIVGVVLAIVFLVLWLRARSGGGGDAGQQLKAAQNQVALLKGDAIQAKREHQAEVEKLTKELENLRAVAGGRVPPELEMWKAKAEELEKKLDSELGRHRAELERVMTALSAGGGSADATTVSPGGAKDRLTRLEEELAEARKELEAAKAQYEADLTEVTERLNSEKAAALQAQARRHASEIQALGGKAPAAETVGAEGADPEGVPDSARFPFLLGTAGAAKGVRHYLPYDIATLGRADTNTVVLQEGMASRIHAEVRFDGKEFSLTDRNSTNGTMLNEELTQSARLGFGDEIGVGETRLRFTCEAAERAKHDPAAAEKAYEAMIRLAPNCRPALEGLATLLQRDPGRADEVRAIRSRLKEISA
jgi:ElaB/YqjD/DUF883 family membrane-anchored ribosome-binding protein